MSRANIDEVVAAALKTAGNDDAKAIKILIEKSENNSDLRAQLLWEGASQILRNHYSRRRKSARKDADDPTPPFTPPTSEPKVDPAGGGASRYDNSEDATQSRRDGHAAEFWSKYTLYGHMLLRDASVRDLRISAQQHRAQMLGHKRSAEFEERLANVMTRSGVKTNNVKVDQFFTLQQVIKLSKECEAVAT